MASHQTSIETDQPRIIEDPNDIWEENKSMIIGVILVVILGVGGTSLWFTNKQATLTEANQMYADAKNAEAWQKIVDQYPETPSAALSLLQLANDSLEKNDFKKAEPFYSSFLQKFPDHFATPSVEFAYASVLEAQGKQEEATSLLQKIVNQSPPHPFTEGASLRLAKTYIAQDQIELARETLNRSLEQSTSPTYTFETQQLLNSLPAPPKPEIENTATSTETEQTEQPSSPTPSPSSKKE